jgi:S-adenosylmethionine:tRNA ribosyltransferase-isomerase
MLRTALLEYDLPPDRIATRPVEPRDSARLMIVDRRDPSRVRDALVRDLPDLLAPGDLVVFNSTRVLPARFRGKRIGTGGRIEGLYLHDAPREGRESPRWVCLIKGRHTRAGAEIELERADGAPSRVRVIVEGRATDEQGAWLARVETRESTPATTVHVLESLGLTPLPPYILRARKDRGEDPDQGEPLDRAAYQTVYAMRDAMQGAQGEQGSVAAPTAGLHFTPELLARLDSRGIARAEVVLHVGAGTFKPIETQHVEEHPMHAEWCRVTRDTTRRIEETRQRGGRIVAIGTTSVRTLETVAARIDPRSNPGNMDDDAIALETRLLITPGFMWRWTDALLTNFHLPRSTLLALVGAMLPGSPEESLATLKGLYARAIEQGYRFYSFGDAMLLL